MPLTSPVASAPDDLKNPDWAELRAGLSTRPFHLPSKYFYDDRGSALFDAICDQPEYYPTRAEQALLDRVAPEIARLTRARELIELGAGTARKTRTLIASLCREVGPDLHYAPLDISQYALDEAAAALQSEFPGLRITPLLCDYTRSLDGLVPDPGCLAVFLGSTIGNFRRQQAVGFLGQLQARLAAGDHFVLGVDLVKPVEVLEAAYNDSAGLTAEFNRNILSVINREVDADFEPNAFEHLAFFDTTQRQIEMHLVARSPQRVRLQALDLTLEIAAGERIRTEISRKFDRDRVERLLTDAGFGLEHFFTSADDYFGLALAVVPPGDSDR